ncbi:MAG: hypothetical protein JOZ81_11110 [Chloroflexi bacterium]|nr:hypothetical protein [Chloroflexota bacterium]MBV9547557.1 hypothetical protein [Chloroflexota bacterium]
MKLRLALGAIPFGLTILGLYVPAINGPNLWFGLPSLVVWICMCVVVCTLIMLMYERLAEPESA